MNKDDILAQSRAENQGNDEYERQVLEKASGVSVDVGMMACAIIAMVSVIVAKRSNYGCWVAFYAMGASRFWIKYRHLRRRHELLMAVAGTALGLMFLGLFVWELMGWRHG